MAYSRTPVSDKRKTGTARIVPILLAAGPSRHLPFPKALARFGTKTTLEIAVENCRSLGKPVVVLGCQAGRVRRAAPAGARVVVNRRWRKGQLSSLLAGLRQIPHDAPFLVYPIDHPLLATFVIRRICRAFARRKRSQMIVLPVFGGQVGHPAIFAPSLREELRRARSAREVVYRNPRRVKFVKVASAGILLDFDTPASYRRCLRDYRRLAPRESQPTRQTTNRKRGRSQGRRHSMPR